MAQADAGEQEYESDPEELKRSLATRRREASDDEDEDDEVVKNQRAEIDSDSDQSNEQVDNDDNKSEDGEDSYDEEEEGDDEDRELGEVDDDRTVNLMKSGEDDGAGGHVDGEEDKEKQSSAVPTGGAFYMHDDRFQELSTGRSRRGRGGRRSWGSGDERKWGHDKYEEMNTQEKPHDQKTSRGGFRGRGRRGRGQGRGYSRGRSSNASSSSGHQIFVPKDTTRGGEPREDEIPLSKGSQAHSSKPLRNSRGRGSQHWHEKISHHDPRRSPSAPAKTGNEDVHTKKNVVVSSLSSASPPFYPSVSSTNLVHGIQVGMERLQTNDSPTSSGKKLRNTKSVHTAQNFQPTSQVRGAPAAGNVFYPQSHSQGGRFSSPMQLNGDSKGTRPSGQDFEQHSAVIRPLSSSSQRTISSGNQYAPGEIESGSDTGASFAKGKGTLQASGNGSLMYSGSQVIGHAESLASGDNSNFPAFLPVMQFGGQHGGVPTFGMAFPGYVQPENGIGNPEMTWMPVLTGPGALGASYSTPYAAVDGSYQAHKPGSSRENSTNNLDDLEKPLERPDFTESGVSKRQNGNSSKQPRRYSEMSFSK
ncbi:protein MLN51 homolog isoform X2 [Raphanus sativus]|uniref:Protein MLN51 homolog isoform X2 n=1 Tax=Raphanus sativus TaxID=3726 RepID=A0A6J0KU88_RAPSA|nr:protein MLN51 homolog isoform X2 [Raphanus sativus]XP_018451480.1 protein MLN51 homolog isoform X2 [Raphanus sativus]